jgi:hypothetical protein
MKRVLLIASIIFGLASSANATWQTDLEAVFDHVSTFEELQDWHGGTLGETLSSFTTTSNPSYLPKLLNGDPSPLWVYWEAEVPWNSGFEEWIGPRSAGDVWNGSKSMVIAYKNLRSGSSSPDAGKGPSKMEIFLGDGISPKSGYSEVHMFYMLKLPTGFFRHKEPPLEAEYVDAPVVKHNQILSGFTALDYWGTPTEHALSTSINVYSIYGMNWYVNNISGGGLSNATRLKYNVTYSYPNAIEPGLPGYGYSYSLYEMRDANLATFYEAQEWVGVEFIAKRSTVVGGNDGSITVKFYSSDGTLFQQDSETGLTNMIEYDHFYNKFALGGNWNSEIESHDTTATRFYVDDFIINDTEIAPTYFQMLSGGLTNSHLTCKPGNAAVTRRPTNTAVTIK